MNKIDRYKILIRHLINLGVIESQKDLGVKMGYSNPSAFSQVINGKTSEPKLFANKLANLYPSLNLNWLLTGEGSMILGEETATQQIKFGKFVHVYIGKDAKDDKYVNVDHIVYIEKFSDHIRMITLKDSGFDVYKDCEDIFRYLISLSFSH